MLYTKVFINYQLRKPMLLSRHCRASAGGAEVVNLPYMCSVYTKHKPHQTIKTTSSCLYYYMRVSLCVIDNTEEQKDLHSSALSIKASSVCRGTEREHQHEHYASPSDPALWKTCNILAAHSPCVLSAYHLIQKIVHDGSQQNRPAKWRHNSTSSPPSTTHLQKQNHTHPIPSKHQESHRDANSSRLRRHNPCPLPPRHHCRRRP